jgi:hypothetical protein
MVLRDANNSIVPGSVNYTGATYVATFTPTSPLITFSVYTMTISGANDLANNTMTTATWSFTTGAGVTNSSIWSSDTIPAVLSAADPDPVELGVKFRSSVPGNITGVRFYKGVGNTGTHVGHLWDANGTLLATATFTGESASGWQQVNFATPVAITANSTYVASYYAPNGNYSYNSAYFAGAGVTNGVLYALANGENGGNGVYRYGAGGGFPTSSFNAANYWVDVVFSEAASDSLAPTITSRTPAVNATNVLPWSTITATFSEPIQSSTLLMELRDGNNNLVPSTVSYDTNSMIATLSPTNGLSSLVNYTVTVSGAKDLANNTMTTTTWSFTSISSWRQSGNDFANGTNSGTTSTVVGPQLASLFLDDFNGTTLGSAWGTSSWTSQGGGTTDITVSGGILNLLGGMVTSNTAYSNKPIEGLVQFGAASYQHFGLATNLDAVAGNYWAVFGTAGTTNTLFARVNASGTIQDVNLGALPSGFHTYRVEPTPTGFKFLVDSVLQTTINITFPTNTPTKIAMSAYRGSPNPSLQVASVYVAEYGTSGTFTSSTFDAGSAVVWGLVKWNAQVPAGTTLTVEASVSNDGTNWSNWAVLTNNSSVSSVVGTTPMRYLRYRVLLTTTDATQTPTFQDIAFTF